MPPPGRRGRPGERSSAGRGPRPRSTEAAKPRWSATRPQQAGRSPRRVGVAEPPGRTTSPARPSGPVATRRAVAARPGTVAGVTTSRSSQRSTSSARAGRPAGRGRGRPGRGRARAEGRIRRAVGTSSRRRRPGHVSTPRWSRRGHALAQARAPSRRRSRQALPPHPGRSSIPSSRSSPGRADRRRRERRTARGVPLGERARERRRPGAARAAHHPDETAGRGPLADVGQRLDQPGAAAGRSTTDAAPSSTAGRKTASPTTARRRGRRPSRRRQAGRPRGQVVPDQHQVGPRHVGQGKGGSAQRRPHARRGAERDDGVVDGGGSGDEEDGHAESSAGPPTPDSRGEATLWTTVPRPACGRLVARPRLAAPYDDAHAPPHRGLLRPRQDDHRQVEHVGLQP